MTEWSCPDLTLTPCEAVDREMSCSVSGSSHGTAAYRSGCSRHYDAIGLLRPACVDPASGYRFYQASQLAQLNRVIALKDLGFSLQQVQAILAEQVSAA